MTHQKSPVCLLVILLPEDHLSVNLEDPGNFLGLYHILIPMILYDCSRLLIALVAPNRERYL